MSQPLISLFVVAGLALAGCGSPTAELPPEWKGRDLNSGVWNNVTIAATWSFGLEYVFPKDKTVDWDWVILQDGLVHFQLFLMLNGQPIPVGSQSTNSSKQTYTTRQAGTYVFVWDLEGMPGADLHYRMPEGPIQHHWPAGSGPGCPGSRVVVC